MPLDPIAAVEAAYRVDRTREAWVAGALEAVAPALRGDVACCAVPYRVVDDRIVPSPPTVVPDTPAIRDAAAHILDVNAREVVDKVIRRPWAFSSMSEHIPEVDPMAAHVIEVSAPLRARDSVSLVVRDHPTDGVIFASLSSRTQRTDAAERARMARVAAHLATGHRLVGAFDGPDDALVEAVLDPDGRLHHAAREAARSRAAREGLRARVRDIERARGRMRREDPDGALQLWRGLVRGTWSLVDHFDHDGRRFVLAVRNASGYLDPRALTPRERHVANLVAGGATNAEIAYALGLREQTVARVASRVFRKLHLPRRADLLRLLSPRGTSAAARVGELEAGVLASPATPPPLPPGLTPAEQAVVRALWEGQEAAAIARARGVSVRTVRNQVSSVYRKLGVCRREELLARLEGATPTTP